MHCPKCQHETKVKNGRVRGLQRYRCKQCGCNYTQSHGHGHPTKDKVLAVVLHLSGMSLNSIGEVIGVTAQSVMRWVKAFADTTEMPEFPAHPVEVEIDEMHHFLLKKLKKSGSGKCWIMQPPGSLAGSVVIAVQPPARR
jgi:transposase